MAVNTDPIPVYDADIRMAERFRAMQAFRGRNPRRFASRIAQIRRQMEAEGRGPSFDGNDWCPSITARRMKKWRPGTPVWQTVLCPPRRHPIRYLLRLPGRFWRALTWGNRNGYQKPKRMSRRAWREWESTWGPRDGNWDRWGRERRVYA